MQRNKEDQNTSEKWVLITGASSGIGAALGEVFAKNHYNLVLVARREELLLKIKNELQEKYSVNILIVVLDLVTPHSIDIIKEFIISTNISIDILVNNAGIGYCGEFKDIDYEKHKRTIDLNTMVLTELTWVLSKEMIKNNKGKILNIASTGAYQPGPLTAVYYATKAYVLSLSNALYNELKPYNVTVTALCPGATDTEFSVKAGKGTLSNSMSSMEVAQKAYIGLIKGKRLVVPGIINKLSVGISNVIPSSILAVLVRKIQDSAMKKYKE